MKEIIVDRLEDRDQEVDIAREVDTSPEVNIVREVDTSPEVNIVREENAMGVVDDYVFAFTGDTVLPLFKYRINQIRPHPLLFRKINEFSFQVEFLLV